ncbi:MAG: hypothetical protein MZV64_42970 [Ignavibacteriales bacterium]|nr:hypothetical protein [Ignavibacteriales bacterium]
MRLRPAREVDAEPAHHPQLRVEPPAAFLGGAAGRPVRRGTTFSKKTPTGGIDLRPGDERRRRERRVRPPRRRAWRAPWRTPAAAPSRAARPGAAAPHRSPGTPSEWPRRAGCRSRPAR